MIILAVATEITLLQEKLNLPRYCIGKFFFLLLQTDYLPEKLGIPTAQIEKSPLPVYVHQIKTSLLKLTNDFLRSSWRVAEDKNEVIYTWKSCFIRF